MWKIIQIVVRAMAKRLPPPRHPDELFDNGRLPPLTDESLEADEDSKLRMDIQEISTIGSKKWVLDAKRKGIGHSDIKK